jgi:hypothetical protein
MDWIKDLIIPLITSIIIIGVVGWIMFIFGRMFYFIYKKQVKFMIKYWIFRKPYPEDIVNFCIDAIGNNMNPIEIKIELLKNGNLWDQVHETLFIFDDISKRIKREESKT